MIIARLGWGSLIWKPDALELASEWFKDGPQLPIEFARVSDSGELATAICANAHPCKVLWAVLRAASLSAAYEALRLREQIPEGCNDGIGVFKLGGTPNGVISEWASTNGADAVIWTALLPRFEGVEGRIPSLDEAFSYPHGLTSQTRDQAFQYLSRVPAQIDTSYRRELLKRLGQL